MLLFCNSWVLHLRTKELQVHLLWKYSLLPKASGRFFICTLKFCLYFVTLHSCVSGLKLSRGTELMECRRGENFFSCGRLSQSPWRHGLSLRARVMIRWLQSEYHTEFLSWASELLSGALRASVLRGQKTTGRPLILVGMHKVPVFPVTMET